MLTASDPMRFAVRGGSSAGVAVCGIDGEREAIVIDDQDSRSSLSVGLDWSARVTTIGLEFCVPAVLGHVVDRWLSTAPWLTVLGALLGMAIGMLHVLRLPGELARADERAKAGARRKPGDSPSRNVPD
ncbi:MAG: AtpZ/AtpI family protein [Paludisphaera borealis]|uniref:AtpZ/AtpI family protein n=1 Tax=Paludisphaera borealis TaxID=1387353 RepID=UPI0028438E9C|nr:AtpZ/AtpI family protein [Paludisphaera borealis]MDR3617874.1 AtpZ/AtpI family protein [Paludisphaera borealis]